MTSFTERIRLIFDVDSAKAQDGIRGVRSQVRDADGAFGKLRAAGKAAFTELNNRAGTFAAGAGLALVAWAVKGATKFEEMAKAALDLGKATGLSTEEASRWIAVGDDFTVSAEALTTSVGRIGKTLDGVSWRKYGIETRDAGGEARGTNEIMLDALDLLSKTTNETERAKIGNELFGKSYSGLAPLIGKTRTEYEKMLGAVSDGQVITDAEAQKAEQLRLAQDHLTDALGDLQIALADVIVVAAPAVDVLAKVVDGVTSGYKAFLGADAKSPATFVRAFSKAVDEADGSVAGIVGSFDELRVNVFNALSTIDQVRHSGDEWWQTRRTFNELLKVDPGSARAALDLMTVWVNGAENGSAAMQEAADANGLNRDRLNELEAAYRDSGAAAKDAADATLEDAAASQEAADAAWKLLDAKNALIDSQLGVNGALRTYQDSMDALAGTEDDAKTTKNEVAEATDRAAEAALRLSSSVAEQARKQAEMNGETYTAKDATDDQVAALQAMADSLAPGSALRKQLEGYILQLSRIPGEVITPIGLVSRTSGGMLTGANLRNKMEARAKGGPVAAGTAYTVGENGPETLVMGSQSGHVIPNGGNSPVVINNTFHVPPNPNLVEYGRVVIDAVNSAIRAGNRGISQ